MYYARYVLGTEADLVSIFLALMFLGAGVGIIFWFLYVRKTNNQRRVLIAGGLIIAAPAMLITFLTDVLGISIIMIIAGLGVIITKNPPTPNPIIAIFLLFLLFSFSGNKSLPVIIIFEK